MKKKTKRVRVRDIGLQIGEYQPGRFNSITDIPGVRVGHSTIIRGTGSLKVNQGPVRTGVTAILPTQGNVYENRVVGSAFILNGAGEISGLTQVVEWGFIETPILLTNTHSVGTCSEAVVKYMVQRHPGIGIEHDVVIPIVGECDDSWLNDIGGRHVREQHVFEAIESAKSGPVAEGNVGGGTGMITCDFKAGIGTSSRKIPIGLNQYVLGVLVMSNFGRIHDLRIDGIPMGKILAPDFGNESLRTRSYGSIIAIIGTNAPLASHQIARLCKRSALGIGRVGSYAAHSSGEIILGFTNGNIIPRQGKRRNNFYRLNVLLEEALDPLYHAVVEATEEAILNSLFMAESMEGHSGHKAPALPLDRVKKVLSEWQKVCKK